MDETDQAVATEPTLKSILETLSKARLIELGRYVGVGLDADVST